MKYIDPTVPPLAEMMPFNLAVESAISLAALIEIVGFEIGVKERIAPLDVPVSLVATTR